jgi:hypothetical protein
MNPTSEKLGRDGFFLLDNGVELLLWVGTQVPPPLVQGCLGAAYDALRSGLVCSFLLVAAQSD